MKRKKKHAGETPEIVVPKGYDPTDLLDTDYSGYEEEPVVIEEVKLRFEQDGQKRDV